MTDKIMEKWRRDIKTIFKESTEDNFKPSLPANDEAGVSDDVMSDVPPEINDDEGDSQTPITLTKGLLVQLIDAAVQSAKGDDAEVIPLDDVGGDELPPVDDVVTDEVPAEEIADEVVSNFKEDEVEEPAGIEPNLDVVPGAEEGGEELPPVDDEAGEISGDVDLDDKPAFDVAAVVDKALELFSTNDGSPLGMEVFDQLKAAATGVSEEIPGTEEGAEEGAEEGGEELPPVDDVVTDEVPAEEEGGEVEESVKKKLKFT